MSLVECDILVVGAGAVGLATAAEFATNGFSVIILETEAILGSHTSSRNSEVIHSGIYYDRKSLKAKLCLEGKKFLKDYINQRSIPYLNCGKVIFSNEFSDENDLEILRQHAMEREINADYCTHDQLKELRCIANAGSALNILDTGIFDSNAFIHNLVYDIEENHGIVAKQTQAHKFEINDRTITTVCYHRSNMIKIQSQKVINASGLMALGLLKANLNKYNSYENYFVKGHYFSTNKLKKINQLMYPLPNDLGLGVHLTIDLSGNVKFGPDTVQTSNATNYTQDVTDEKFHQQVALNFPCLNSGDLSFSYTGIRPKIMVNDVIYPDFLFKKDFEDRLVSALGIESPGLTASLAIAKHIASMVM